MSQFDDHEQLYDCVMKIGHVSLSYRPVTGGQETYIENLKRVFEKLGHSNTVYQSLSLRFSIDSSGAQNVIKGFGET